MKKFFILMLCTLLLVTFSGCQVPRYPNETDEEYIISALGFDVSYNEVIVLAQAVINTGKENNGSAKLFKATGKNIETALYNLNANVSKSLYLNHSGLLVLGDKLNQEQLKQVWNYCFSNKNITQAIEVVCTNNCQELLSSEANSEVSSGYEFSKLISQNGEYTGVKYKNRFYEIENSRTKKVNSYALPYIKISDEGAKIDGIQVYYDDTQVLRIDEAETPLYAIFTDNYNMGNILLEGKKYGIDVDSVEYDFELINGKLKNKITITIDNNEDTRKVLESGLNKVSIFKKDIYGIADKIYKRDKKLWEKIKKQYDSVFENSEIYVVVRRK